VDLRKDKKKRLRNIWDSVIVSNNNIEQGAGSTWFQKLDPPILSISVIVSDTADTQRGSSVGNNYDKIKELPRQLLEKLGFNKII
jgi:hypothetical protein